MKYVTKKRILQYSTARTSRTWLKRIKFKRYDNLSLYKFIKIFTHNIAEDEIGDRANGVAYNFILATFPAIIFLFTMLPYIAIYFPEVTTESIMDFIKELVPESMYGAIASTVFDILSNQRGGLLTLGFFFAVYLSTNGMMALMRAFNSCYRTIEQRHWLHMRLVSLGLTLMLAIVLFSAIILLIVGQFVLDYVTTNIADYSHLNLDSYTIYFLFSLRFAVIFVVFFMAISCIYYFGPTIHYNWSFFSIGSFLATLSIIAISYGFSFYITNFGSYNKVYGSIGALIAMMAWIQLVTIVLLYGYEVNASLHYGSKMEAISSHQRKTRITKSSK
jgi:membrane protein